MAARSGCIRLLQQTQSQEAAGSEIVSCEIDPALSIHLFTAADFSSTTVNAELVKLALSASRIYRAPIHVRQSVALTPFPIGTDGGAMTGHVDGSVLKDLGAPRRSGPAAPHPSP